MAGLAEQQPVQALLLLLGEAGWVLAVVWAHEAHALPQLCGLRTEHGDTQRLAHAADTRHELPEASPVVRWASGAKRGCEHGCSPEVARQQSPVCLAGHGACKGVEVSDGAAA